MAELDYVTLAILGFFTGLGTTFGAKFAETVFSKSSEWVSKRGKNDAAYLKSEV
jgi:hypothetical protein